MSDYDQLAYNLRKPLGVWLLPFTAEHVGAWTPSLVGTTIAGTFTYALQGGTWTRLGNRVLILGRINITAIAVAPTGNLTITGLPITSAATSAAGIAGVVDVNDFTGITYTAGYNKVGGRINVATSVIALTETGSGVGAILLPAAALALVGGVAEFVFTAHYQV